MPRRKLICVIRVHPRLNVLPLNAQRLTLNDIFTMFTGLIEQIGAISVYRSIAGGREIAVAWPGLKPQEVELGESIAVNGACLTVERAEEGRFWASIMPQTAQTTTLGEARVGQRVNLERALQVGDRLGGHFVQGHVDDIVTVSRITPRGDSKLLEIAFPAGLKAYIVARGSVCLDGVSLTVAELSGTHFTVSLVRETQARTTLGEARVGQKINLEVDLLGRHIVAWLESRAAAPASNLAELLSMARPDEGRHGDPP